MLQGLKLLQRRILDSYTKDFMNNLPHQYHEENILHVYFIDLIADYDLALEELCKFYHMQITGL